MAVNLYARSSVSQDFVNDLRLRAANVVQDLAGASASDSNLNYRQLAGTDFTTNGATVQGHLTNPVALVANTWSADIATGFTPQQGAGFVLYGVVLEDATSSLDAIQIAVGAVPIAIIQLHEMKSPGAGTTPQTGFLSEMVWVQSPVHCAITLLAGSAVGQSVENFMFLGFYGGIDGVGVQSQAPPPGSVAGQPFGSHAA